MTLSQEDAKKYTYLIYLHILKEYSFLGYINMHILRRYINKFYDIEDSKRFLLESVHAILKITKLEVVDVFIEKPDENDDLTWTKYYKINNKGLEHLQNFLDSANEHEKELVNFIP